ncbi:gliding motility lipoprotein GldB [Flavobacterium sp.]|uniref:gliding motility lipoprotein GldB n=1 Tax=Flavobacterium sp. TaxID=239 RepID=UPI004047D98C
MNKFLSVLIILLSIISCKNEVKESIDVSEIDVNVSVDRFDQKFYTTTAETLPELKKEFPFLFPEQNPDSIWLNRMHDEGELILFHEAQRVFGDFETEKKQIETLFKHIKYYHPTFQSPKIITLITDLDYRNKVLYSQDYLFISLDMYLGRNDEIYKDFPMYLAHNYDKSQLTVDIAFAIGNAYFSPQKNRQFVDLIINEGKKMYQLDCYLPAVSDAQKMGYNKENLDWAQTNELYVWQYFVENKLLYSTDSDLYSRFIFEAPFSKFYIDIDKESPGRIGVWLGWQIVRSYMKNNDVTLQQLLQTNAEEIFKNSKYKPKK